MIRLASGSLPRTLAALAVAAPLVAGCTAVVPAVVISQPPPPVSAPPPAPALPNRAAGLVGESSETVLTTLGPPALKRDEGEAEFWLYTAKSGCRINVVLYRESNGEHVAHAAANTPPRTSEAACLRAIAGAPLS